MGLSLFEIDDNYKQALAELEAMDDLDPQIIEDSLAGMKDDVETKCLSVGAFIKNLDAEANAIKEAKDGLAAREKSIANKAKRMREYLAAHLPNKLTSPYVSLTPLKGREKIVVDNAELLPESCFKTTRSQVAAEVKKQFDSLPVGAASKVIGNASVMIK